MSTNEPTNANANSHIANRVQPLHASRWPYSISWNIYARLNLLAIDCIHRWLDCQWEQTEQTKCAQLVAGWHCARTIFVQNRRDAQTEEIQWQISAEDCTKLFFHKYIWHLSKIENCVASSRMRLHSLCSVVLRSVGGVELHNVFVLRFHRAQLAQSQSMSACSLCAIQFVSAFFKFVVGFGMHANDFWHS